MYIDMQLPTSSKRVGLRGSVLSNFFLISLCASGLSAAPATPSANVSHTASPSGAGAKPGFHISPQDVLDSTTHEQGGRRITIRQIKPIALPTTPLPIEPTADAAVQQRLTHFRHEHPTSTCSSSVLRFFAPRVRRLARLSVTGPLAGANPSASGRRRILL